MSDHPSTVDLKPFPDHTQLPESDGIFVKNFQEHPQSIILTDSILPILERLHPDGDFCVGQDSGIYWRETDPPERGAEAPDWFYVPHVPARPETGSYRRSYVLWRELISPLIALEFASGDGSEERDQTPLSRNLDGTTTRPGKFWVYEQIIRIAYYGIFEMGSNRFEFYQLMGSQYQQLSPNQRGHYPIPEMEVELGLWQGSYLAQERLWLRWWDLEGNLVLMNREQVVGERQRADQERRKRQALADRLRNLSPEQLQDLGIDPELLG